MAEAVRKSLAVLPIGFGRALHVFLGVGACCRFEPTCSIYAGRALEAHGLARGSWLTFLRLLRCHPWGGWGSDPVPPRIKMGRKI